MAVGSGRGIVKGQRLDNAKTERAKDLRARMTSSERRLWAQLRTNKLGGLHFRSQQIIDGFIVDFYCDSCGLVVEVDGAIHELQRQADHERDAILEGRGLRVIRFTNEDVDHRLNSTLIAIMRASNGRNPATSIERETALPPGEGQRRRRGMGL